MARTQNNQQVESVPTNVGVMKGSGPAYGAVETESTTSWGAIWGGLVATIAVFLLLETLLIAFGAITYTTSGGTVTVHTNDLWITGILALISFFFGGWLAAATSAVRGIGAGLINSMLVWALATSLFVVGSFLGAGAALGAV